VKKFIGILLKKTYLSKNFLNGLPLSCVNISSMYGCTNETLEYYFRCGKLFLISSFFQ